MQYFSSHAITEKATDEKFNQQQFFYLILLELDEEHTKKDNKLNFMAKAFSYSLHVSFYFTMEVGHFSLSSTNIRLRGYRREREIKER